jgi:Domain of unknown function (DUF4331)
MIRHLGFATIAMAAIALSACGGEDSSQPVAPPTVAPVTPPVAAGLSIDACLAQTVANGRSLQNILIPDVLVLDLSQPAGFPNGRKFEDPVIDLEFAALFLDLRTQPVTTFVTRVLNPNVFDQPLRTTFPYYGAPLGSPTLSATNGVNFNFRTDPTSAYTRVDRMGLPAVSTAVVVGSSKLVYNDSTPTVDAAGTNAPLILEGYRNLTNALNDDFKALGLTPCAT